MSNADGKDGATGSSSASDVSVKKAPAENIAISSNVHREDFEKRWNLRNLMYERLCQFKEKNGHVRPTRVNCVGKTLVSWVNYQRRAHTNQKLLPNRVQKLESLGIMWPRSRYDGTGARNWPASDRRIATNNTGTAEKSTFEGKRPAENEPHGFTNTTRKQHSSDIASRANGILFNQNDMSDGLFDGESGVVEQEHVVYMTCPTNAKPASAGNERKPKLSGLYVLLENLVNSRRGQSAEHAALA
jgi:hypothetical protein